MPGASSERHANDDTLVAYLDRELPPGERSLVEHHLGECWSCRTRAAEIEQDIHLVTRAIESENESGGEEVKRALQTFHARRAEFEFRRTSRSGARWQFPRLSLSSVPLAPALAVLVGAGAAALWFHGSRDPRPASIVVQAAASEQKLHSGSQPSRQVLRLEARTQAEAAPRDLGKLEIWSDAGAGGRYSSRWTDPGDNLKYAVWRPTASTAFSYDTNARRTVLCSQPAGSTHLVDWLHDAADFASVEAAFLRWMRSRAWTLVSFTEEWAVFADREGTHVQVERLRYGPRSLWRLSASRVDRDHTVEMDLHVDAETYLPSVQAVRVRANGRVAELRLTVERWQSVRPQEVQPAVFTPPAPVWTPERRPAPTLEVPRPFVADRPAGLPEWALADLELRLRWALHEAQECVNVRVGRERDSGIVVRLLALGEGRRAALERILDGIEGRDYIRVVPDGNPTSSSPSHVAMIQRHARLLDELAGRAGLLEGLTPQQELQYARLFADHRRSLRLEMAHLEAQLPDSGPVSREVADLPIAPRFLASQEARAVVARTYEYATALSPVEHPDAPSVAGLTRALAALDGVMLSLENSMRRGGHSSAATGSTAGRNPPEQSGRPAVRP